MSRVTVTDTPMLLLAVTVLMTGCADGTIPASKSLDDPSNPASPEAALTPQPAIALRPASSTPDALHDMESIKHQMPSMKHDMGAMKDGGSP